MGKKDVSVLLVRGGFLFLSMVMFFTTAAAKDWSELNEMKELELIEKVDELKIKLDQKPDDYETLKVLGIVYHMLAREDPKKYTRESVDILLKVYDMNKKDYVVLCYLGSSTTMMAVTTWNPMKKGSYANKGIALMDKAVRKDPDNAQVRLTRAYNSMSLPGFLNRGEVAIEDFEYLAGMIEESRDKYGHLKKEVFGNLIDLYKKNGKESEASKYANRLKEK